MFYLHNESSLPGTLLLTAGVRRCYEARFGVPGAEEHGDESDRSQRRSERRPRQVRRRPWEDGADHFPEECFGAAVSEFYLFIDFRFHSHQPKHNFYAASPGMR